MILHRITKPIKDKIMMVHKQHIGEKVLNDNLSKNLENRIRKALYVSP